MRSSLPASYECTSKRCQPGFMFIIVFPASKQILYRFSQQFLWVPGFCQPRVVCVMNSRVPDNPFFAFLLIYLHILSSSTCVTLQLVFDLRKKPQTSCIDFCLLYREFNGKLPKFKRDALCLTRKKIYSPA